jgi:branched-chain amino acid transport system substrate-binding protein
MLSTYGSRRSARRATTVVACGLALSLGLVACSSSGKSSGGATTTAASVSASTANSSSAAAGPKIPDGPIKIGIVAGTSGADSAIGNLVKTEYTAYANFLNKQGGIAGHQIQLVIENNQSDPTVAVTAAKKLVSEGVVATFYNGSTAEAKDQVVAIEQKAKIIGIAPEALETYDSPTQNPYYFSDNALNSQVTAALAAFAKTKSFDDFGVLSDSSPQAKDYVTEFAKSAATNGLKISSSTSYPSTATTMTTQLSTLKEAGAKTLALFCYSGCGQVFDSLRQINWKPNILVSPNIYYTAFKSVGDYGSATYSACPYSVKEGAQPPTGVADAINAIAPQLGGPSALDQVFPETADAFFILKYAIEKANSTDGDALKAALETMTAQTFTDPDVTFTFSAQHHAGYQPGTADKLMPVCGFTALGALQLPSRVTS